LFSLSQISAQEKVMSNIFTPGDSYSFTNLPGSSLHGTQRMRTRHFNAPLPTLFRLLPLLIALAVGPRVVFAQQGGNDQGKGNDPTGAWIVTDTSPGSDGQPSVLATFHKDGTTAGDVRGDVTGFPEPAIFASPEHGVWKKTGARTFTGSFISLWYNRDNSLYGIFEVDANFQLDASSDQYDAKYVAYVTLANGQVNNFGSGTAHGRRIPLKPPVF
jgi:hypothetical protein